MGNKNPITVEVDGEVFVLDELPEKKAFALECYLGSLLNGLRVNWDAYEEAKEYLKLFEETIKTFLELDMEIDTKANHGDKISVSRVQRRNAANRN